MSLACTAGAGPSCWSRRSKVSELRRTTCVQERRALLADAMEAANFSQGQVVYRQGDVAESFYLIATGTATASRADAAQPSTSLQTGGYFGERALLKPDPR